MVSENPKNAQVQALDLRQTNRGPGKKLRRSIRGVFTQIGGPPLSRGRLVITNWVMHGQATLSRSAAQNASHVCAERKETNRPTGSWPLARPQHAFGATRSRRRHGAPVCSLRSG